MNSWFNANGFTPHGFCLAWDSDLVTVVVLANALIALAYLIITVTLVMRAVGARPVVPRWLYWTYACLIFCCGLSHLVDDVTIWVPVHPLQAVVLSATAFISLLAALLPITIWIRLEAERVRR